MTLIEALRLQYQEDRDWISRSMVTFHYDRRVMVEWSAHRSVWEVAFLTDASPWTDDFADYVRLADLLGVLHVRGISPDEGWQAGTGVAASWP